MRKLFVLLALASFLASACSSKPQPEAAKSEPAKTEPRKPQTDFDSGRAAFQRMYVAARGWAADVQPVRLESRPTRQDPKDGKAAMWSATFVSPSRQNVRSYTWSGIEGADQGITPGNTDYYSPANASTRPFDLNFLKVDSTDALETAQKKGGEAVLKKDPETPLKYMLFFDQSKGRLLWRVVYGGSVSDSKLRILVNATTGEFVAKEK